MEAALRDIAPQQHVRGSIQPSAAGPGARSSDDYYNRDLPPLPLEESDISESSQASSPPSATNIITGQNSESIERDFEFKWSEDGNVVVVAQNTAFRFHRGSVSPNSSVLHDLLSSPQPSAAGAEDHVNESFDGGPVVRISDTSYDFRDVLQAMHDSMKYLHPDQAVASPVLITLASLSHKYELDELFATVIYRLGGIFPTQLEVWDGHGGVDGHGLYRLSSADAIEALNLFRLIDRPDMITTALYRCAQLEPRSILHGEMRADGVTRELLSPSDMELCFKIKEELMQATACLLTRLYEACGAIIAQVHDDPDCLSPGTCRRGLRTVRNTCLENLRKHVSTDPLDMYYISVAASSRLDGMMCRVCGDMFVAACSQERRKLWAELPGLMGICIDVDNWGSV